MAGIKNKKVCELLKKWLRNSGMTQLTLSARYKVTQPVISKQLSGQESIPIERIQDIIDITNPPAHEITQMNNFLKAEEVPQPVHDKTGLMRALVNAYGHDMILQTFLWYWKDVTDDDIKKYITPLILDIRARLKDKNESDVTWAPDTEEKFVAEIFPEEK